MGRVLQKVRILFGSRCLGGLAVFSRFAAIFALTCLGAARTAAAARLGLRTVAGATLIERDLGRHAFDYRLRCIRIERLAFLALALSLLLPCSWFC